MVFYRGFVLNDFTKEELKYLFRKFMLTNGDDFEHRLEAKLQSLINNYCEHESVRSISDADYVYVCAQCDKVVKYE